MADEHGALRDAMARLREQLENLKQLDADLAAELGEVLSDAQAAIEGRPHEARHQSLGDRLRDAVLRFEASHPVLAGSLQGFVDAVGQAGI